MLCENILPPRRLSRNPPISHRFSMKSLLRPLQRASIQTPLSAEIKHKVIGFVLFRRLSLPDAQHQVFRMEGGRMRVGARNHGVGYETIRVAIPLLQLVHARSESYRFLASIDSYNKPPQRVFQTCLHLH